MSYKWGDVNERKGAELLPVLPMRAGGGVGRRKTVLQMQSSSSVRDCIGLVAATGRFFSSSQFLDILNAINLSAINSILANISIRETDRVRLCLIITVTNMKGRCYIIRHILLKSIELSEISMAEQSTITRVHRLRQILNRFFSSSDTTTNFCT